MAVITTAQRDRVWRAFMRRTHPEPLAVTKATIRAAVDACDDWIDGASTTVPTTSINTGCWPTAFRTAATQAQKSLLFALICLERAGEILTEGL